MAGILPDSDDDGDSIATLFEYAYNLNPAVQDYLMLTENSGVNGLPRWNTTSGVQRLSVEFIRRKDATDITYQVQFTDNLMSNWVDTTATEIITPIDDEWERVKIEDTEAPPTRFGKAGLIHNPAP